MPQIEYRSPGVFGIEKTPATAPENLSPGVAGFVGWTEEGPTNTPIKVRSVEEFSSRFGPITSNGVIPLSMRAYFGTGGQEAYIVRVAPADAVKATASVTGGASPGTAGAWVFTATGEGTWANTMDILIRGNRNYINRSTKEWTRFDVLVRRPSEYDSSIKVGEEVYEAVQFTDASGGNYILNVISDDRNPSQLVTLALGAGGNPTALLGADVTAENVGTGTGSTATTYTDTLASAPLLDLTLVITAEKAAVADENLGIGVGAALDLSTLTAISDVPIKPGSVTITYNAGTGPTATITDDGSGGLTGDVLAGGTIDYDTGELTGTTDVSALAGVGDDFECDYTPLMVATDNGIGGFTGDVDTSGTNTIDYDTGAVSVKFDAAVASSTAITAAYRSLPKEATYAFSSGADGTSVSRSVISAPALETSKAGIYALDSVEEPLNVCVPDFEGVSAVQLDLIDFAEARNQGPGTRFAILGAATGTSVAEAIKYNLVDLAQNSRSAAFYYPNIKFVNDLNDYVEVLPVTPFIAGIYAKTANNKNVGKSPAGIDDGALDGPGTVGPELDLSLADRDALYQARINPVFESTATGFVVWGARSLSLEARWRYLNARLLHNFLMHRLFILLQFAVFENNGPALWLRIEQAIKGYMDSLFTQGYFAGGSSAEAFFVKCNSSNNNDQTVSEGKVIVDVGFAPNKPAEFVIFRLQQPASATSA